MVSYIKYALCVIISFVIIGFLVFCLATGIDVLLFKFLGPSPSMKVAQLVELLTPEQRERYEEGLKKR